MVYFMENPMKMDDLGVSILWERELHNICCCFDMLYDAARII